MLVQERLQVRIINRVFSHAPLLGHLLETVVVHAVKKVLHPIRVPLLREAGRAFKNAQFNHDLHPLCLVLLLKQFQIFKKVLYKDK